MLLSGTYVAADFIEMRVDKRLNLACLFARTFESKLNLNSKISPNVLKTNVF